MKYCKNIHDVVKVNSNFPFPGFEVGEVSDPDIIIEVKKDINFSKEGLSRLDFWFYGKEGGDFVYYEDTFFGVKNKVLLKNLNGQTEVLCNKSVLRLDRFYPPRSRRSFNDLVGTIIRIKLIKNGYLNIHAACLSKDGTTILLAAFPQTGKTLSALQLLKEGFKYISEDTVLIDSKGNAYFTPTISAIHYDFLKFMDRRKIGFWKYYKILLKTWIIKKSEFMNRILEPPKINLLEMVNNEPIRKSKVKIACTLEIGDRRIEEVDKETLAKKILAINRYSLPRIVTSPFIWAYSYFNDFDITEIEEMERRNLLNFLEGCECFNLACNDKNWISLFKDMGVV
ncbi:MAG: hypothetical protein J7K87_00855 [Candidatus Aenigmarchaeota archaeon]|nr:hypothetical protein [Candidatus Aenigmarchaeota archaeon]